jgi:zinc/manganese transport system substrate-binding protein
MDMKTLLNKRRLTAICSILGLLILAMGTISCSKKAGANSKKGIVVTYSVLGSVVQELVGDTIPVTISIPNGLDVHEWEPSAKDIEALSNARVIVKNGLNLEEGMEGALASAEKAGVPVFVASDYIEIRHVGKGEGLPSGDPDQAEGAEDPHLWTNPENMKAITCALSDYLKMNFKIDRSAQAQKMAAEFDAEDAEIQAQVQTLPKEKRLLVTGHESMGYFAQHYGFKLVGAIVPGLSTQAESSASELSSLSKTIKQTGAKVIFTEIGTPAQVAKTLATESGCRTVELSTHNLVGDNTYASFIKGLSSTILDNLK